MKDPLDCTPEELDAPYSDLTPMPFGAYKGKKLIEVPDQYLYWLWEQRPISDRKLQDYIKENLDAIVMGLPDEDEDDPWLRKW